MINKAICLIEQNHGFRLDPEAFNLSDPKVYQLLSSGDTDGIFQLESSGMKELVVKLRPERFEDLIALVALYRPGPLGSGMVDDFIKRKHGLVSIEYEIPELEDVLRETYGIILYQEQVMQIASQLADFSLGDADILRRAMGKKKSEEMEKQKEKFLSGARKKGIQQKKAERIFELMGYFAEYGFNKSHSAAYAMVSFQTAFLKANYPAEFMAALLSSEMGDADKVMKYLSDCREKGLLVLPPDINESYGDFSVTREGIRFGLAAVKNVGLGAIDSIVEGREKDGQYTSLYDFCRRVDLRRVNKRVVESLIKCGAFDSTGAHRSQMMLALETAIEKAQQDQRAKENPQMNMFGMLETEEKKEDFMEIEEWPENQLLSNEKDVLGFYLTGHPLARFEKLLNQYATISTTDFRGKVHKSEVRLGGVVSQLKEINTRKGDRMAFATVEDLNGFMEVVVFADLYKERIILIKSGEPILVVGRLELEGEKGKIIAQDIIPLEEAQEGLSKRVHFRVNTLGLTQEQLKKLKIIFEQSQGECEVYLHLVVPNKGETILQLPDEFCILLSKKLINEVTDLFGYQVMEFQ